MRERDHENYRLLHHICQRPGADDIDSGMGRGHRLHDVGQWLMSRERAVAAVRRE